MDRKWISKRAVKIRDDKWKEAEIQTGIQYKRQDGFVPGGSLLQAIITRRSWNLVDHNPTLLGQALPKPLPVKPWRSCSLNLSRSVTFRKFPEDYSVLKKPSLRPLPTALYELSSTAFPASLDYRRLELHCHCLFLPSGATRLTVPQVLPTLACSDLFTTIDSKPSPKLNCHLSCPRHFPHSFLLLTIVKATAVCPRPLLGVKWHRPLVLLFWGVNWPNQLLNNYNSVRHTCS